jgi:large subunit ribosomal protein L15
MRLHDLKPAAGSHRDRKRLGRGNASGQGTTAGKGTKGEKARSGGLKAGFRGMSSRNARTAKRRGFTNIWKVEYQPVNVRDLEKLGSGAQITVDSLRAAGLVRGKDAHAKILGEGELTVAVHVVDLKVSASARQKIEAAGGTVSGEAPAEALVSAAPAATAEAAPAAPAEAAAAASTVAEPAAPTTDVDAPPIGEAEAAPAKRARRAPKATAAPAPAEDVVEAPVIEETTSTATEEDAGGQ